MTRTKFRGAQLELFDKDIDEHDVDRLSASSRATATRTGIVPKTRLESP